MQLKEKSLFEIKRDVALITLDIENLDPGKKQAAIIHLKETIDLLQLGANKRFKEDSEAKDSPEKKIKLDPENHEPEDSDKDWMFNENTFGENTVDNGSTKTADIMTSDEYYLAKSLYCGLIPTCEICSSTFITVGALDTHMKTNHANIKHEETCDRKSAHCL